MSQGKEVKITLSPKKLMIGISVVIIVVGGLLWAILGMKDAPISTADARPDIEANVIQGGNATSEEELEARIAEMQQKVDDSMIALEIAPTLIFENGEAMGEVRIANPAKNKYGFTVTLKIEETDEEVYKSGLIPPDAHIKQAKLDKPLEKGDYPAIAYFTTYDEEGNMVGQAGINVLISVLN